MAEASVMVPGELRVGSVHEGSGPSGSPESDIDAQGSPEPRRTSKQSPPASNADAVPANEPQIDPDLLNIPTEEAKPMVEEPAPLVSLPPVIPSSLYVSVDQPRPVHPALRLAMETALPPSENPSPATPIGLGREGLYHGYDMSRQSSSTDLGSYIGATKGTMASASSESEYDYSQLDTRLPEEREPRDTVGVPPPKETPKKSHARKQPEGHIKRARNAFILFRKHITDSNLIPPSVEVKHQNISVVAAKMWREAPQDVRSTFQEQARIEKEEHQRKYPGYRYQPVFRRTDIIRRRVRKDPAEDDKVDAVAEALIKGKAGNDLEKDIKDQMASRSDMSDSDADASVRGGSRRRRKDVGQLSKGALRAQRAQARAKAMRQNLLGSNILSMSMYNAAAQANSRMNHPGAQHHLQYAMAESYLPMGYDMQSIYDQGAYPAPMDTGDIYHLPPIDNVGAVYDGNWTQGADYWNPDAVQGAEYPVPHPNLQPPQPIASSDYYAPPPLHGVPHDYGMPPVAPVQPLPQEAAAPPPKDVSQGLASEYQIPPVDPQAPHHHAEPEKRRDPALHEWAREGQQTPSGHVIFNERLFDGALGSATLPALGDSGPRDEGLAGFDEAITQAIEMSHW